MSARVASRRPGNAVLLQHANEQVKSLQNRIADAITGLAGTTDRDDPRLHGAGGGAECAPAVGRREE